MGMAYDVAVIGGGAIGCAIAWRAAQAGLKVVVLEQSVLGAGATQAAAGMLGAQSEMHKQTALWPLCLESRSEYKEFAAELMAETGIDIELSETGTLRIAHTQAAVQSLKAQAKWQAASGGHSAWLEASELSGLEPTLAPSLGALWLPEDGNVSAPQLGKALAAAARRHATVREGVTVQSIESRSAGVRLETSSGPVVAENVVLSTGAWAGRQLGANQWSSEFGFGPVKGQLFAIRARGQEVLRRTIVTDIVYLVPKRDGSIIVGATVEPDAGFDDRLTVRAVRALTSALAQVAPGLIDCELERLWTGFRPGATDQLPVIGRLPDDPRILLAVGHYRNGILLTPITAKMIVHELVYDAKESSGQERPAHWLAFTPAKRRANAQTAVIVQ